MHSSNKDYDWEKDLSNTRITPITNPDLLVLGDKLNVYPNPMNALRQQLAIHYPSLVG